MEHQQERGEPATATPDHLGARYEYVSRQAGQLAYGELALEPALGLARVAAVHRADPPYVKVTWHDDAGPCRATARYPVDLLFPVRIPAPEDRLRIRHAIDQAAWRRREISGAAARLIA